MYGNLPYQFTMAWPCMVLLLPDRPSNGGDDVEVLRFFLTSSDTVLDSSSTDPAKKFQDRDYQQGHSNNQIRKG